MLQGGHRRCLRLFPAPLLRLHAGLHGRPVGDAVQPAAQGFAAPDRTGLPGQDQKGGLKRVLDVVLVFEHSPASGQDHRPMAGHQCLKCDLVVRAGITGQELPVRQPGGRSCARRGHEGVERPSPTLRSPCDWLPPKARRPARPVQRLRGESSRIHLTFFRNFQSAALGELARRCVFLAIHQASEQIRRVRLGGLRSHRRTPSLFSHGNYLHTTHADLGGRSDRRSDRRSSVRGIDQRRRLQNGDHHIR